MKTPNHNFECHKTLSSFASQYDGFILDQFGVMHNGKFGLEGAPDCVKQLQDMGKKLIIMSNTSSPSEAASQKLPKLGFDPSMFLDVVTSGEEASQYIKDHYSNKKALWLTWPRDQQPNPLNFWNQCGDDLKLLNPKTDKYRDADVIIAHGSGIVRGSIDGDTDNDISLGDFFTTGNMEEVIQPILKECASHGIPMVCANPDYITINPDGISKSHMPGAMARLYEKIGGTCLYFGKPNVAHFEACIQKLNLPRDKVVHVGDSLHHDIKGANDANIDSVFVTNGVHRDELYNNDSNTDDNIDSTTTNPSMEALQTLFDTEGGYTPTHVVPMFRM